MKYSKLEESILNFLCKKKFQEVFKILRLTENKTLISENVWNLIKLICSIVKEKSLLNNEDDVSGCQKTLLFLSDIGNPKEVLIAFLEQADTFKDNEFFCMLLEPLQVVLKKTPGKRGKSLHWVLSSLNAHIENLKNPQDLDLQNEEKLLLDADPAVQDAAYVLKNYLKFIQFFVNEVSFENLKQREFYYFDRLFYQQEILQKYILRLLHHPLLYHDLTIDNTKPKSSVQVICEGFINCLSKICHNVFNLFDLDYSNSKTFKTNEDIEENENNVSILSFSNLSYLIFVENMTLHFQPLVYSHHFIFLKSLKYISPLLKQRGNLVLYKGLQLGNALVRHIDNFELKLECTGHNEFIDFPNLLFEVAIFSQVEAHRHSAFKLFQTFASKCDFKLQYYIIMKILSKIEHSGTQGVLIDLYKKNLHEELNNRSSCTFSGRYLSIFIEKAFVLKDGVETDIVENSDKIVAALNLLKYLFLRDKANITGIWDLTYYISEKFTKPLSIALDMSRAHYKEAMKKDYNSKVKDSLNATVTVNNEVLPNIPPSFQKDFYKAVLTTFDLIEYIMVQVKELMSE